MGARRSTLVTPALAVALTACSNETPAPPPGPSPHSVEIDLEGGAAKYEEDILVLLSHEDGSLVASWKGTELPVEVDALDGDLVSFVKNQQVFSYRVESGVDRVKKTLFEAGEPEPPSCTYEKMHLDVTIPSFPGATNAKVWAAGAGYGTTTTLPAVVPVDVATCESTVRVLTVVEGPDGWIAFERQTLPLVPDSSVTLQPTFPSPRKKLTIDVTGAEAALESSAYAVVVDEDFGYLEEPGNANFFLDVPPEWSFVDLPTGTPTFGGVVQLPPPEGACSSDFGLLRIGASDTPLPFHVAELGAPTEDGDTWTVDGPPGTRMLRLYVGSTKPEWSWFVTDDPHVPRRAVLPTFPDVGPDLGEVKLRRVEQYDEGGMTYGEWLTDVPLLDAGYRAVWDNTYRYRSTRYVCD